MPRYQHPHYHDALIAGACILVTVLMATTIGITAWLLK